MINQGPWKQGTEASTFNEREFQVCTTARLIEDGESVLIRGSLSMKRVNTSGVLRNDPAKSPITVNEGSSPSFGRLSVAPLLS